MNQTSTQAEQRALIVVDMQQDFCAGGALPAVGCDRIVPVLNRYVAEAEELGMAIYASRDWHPPITTHFKRHGGVWPAHCVQGTRGAEFHPALRLPATTVVITKGDHPDQHGYSAFDGHTQNGASFLEHLRDRRIGVLYVTGVATEYCVKQTTLDALRGGLRVTVLTDAIAAINDRPEDVDRALLEMSHEGANLETNIAAPHRR